MPKPTPAPRNDEVKKVASASPRPSRRERVREATLTEIKDVARRLMEEHGIHGVSLRAIAREMGMTAPGLYRYFTSLDDLLMALQADYFGELTSAVQTAIDSLPPQDLDGRVNAALRAFRSWALTYRAEFTLLFGPPGNHHAPCPHEGEAHEAGERFGVVLFALFFQVWQERRFTPPPDESLTPELRTQLTRFAAEAGGVKLGRSVPIGAVRILAGAWIRLYGLICMEVFHQLHYMVEEDMAPLFEAELADQLEALGVRYRPPG